MPIPSSAYNERNELIAFFQLLPDDDRRLLFIDHFQSQTIPAALDYLDPETPYFVANPHVRHLIVEGAKAYILA